MQYINMPVVRSWNQGTPSPAATKDFAAEREAAGKDVELIVRKGTTTSTQRNVRNPYGPLGVPRWN